MAKIYQMEVRSMTQANFDQVAHSLLFADNIECVNHGTPGTETGVANSIVVRSDVESTDFGSDYILLADDSASERSIDISTGKFQEGNLVAFWGPVSEAQSDLRDFVTYFAGSGDIHLHIGVANCTQSQDYTPALIENSRVLKMVSPAQVKNI
jgi:hypothetical protein